MDSLFEPHVRRLMAEEVGGDVDDLISEVSLTDDVAADREAGACFQAVRGRLRRGNEHGGRMVSDSVAAPVSIDCDRETFPPEAALDGVGVLVIEDDADTREAIVAVLAACGAQVVAVGCGADALEALTHQVPDVLVSDIAMPGMDGHSLLRRIRERGARRGRIPAIALTAYASAADRTKALLAGYQIFLPKPCDPTELITLVAQLARPTPSL